MKSFSDRFLSVILWERLMPFRKIIKQAVFLILKDKASFEYP